MDMLTRQAQQRNSSTPPIELIQKLEAAVAAFLTLTPQVIKICVHYVFRPRTFIRRALSTSKYYTTPPYTFLALAALIATVATNLSLIYLEIVTDDIIGALAAFAGPSANEGKIRLAQQLQAVQDRTVTTTLFSAGAVVMCLAALAKTMSMVQFGPSARKLERYLCYVAGAQHIHVAVALPLVAYLLLYATWGGSIISGLLLAIVIAWCVLWPALSIVRVVGTLQRPARRFALRAIVGVLFSILNMTIVYSVLWAADAIPTALTNWRADLLPRPTDDPEYLIRYAHGSIDEQGRLILTVAIQVSGHTPLLLDQDRLKIEQVTYLSSPDWTMPATIEDSSDGKTSLIIVHENETKWLRLAATPIGQTRDLLIHSDGTLSCTISGRAGSIDLLDVYIENGKRLTDELSSARP